MAAIRTDFVYAACNRAVALTDYSIHNTLEKQYEFRKQTILVDESLTKDEKSEAIKIFTKEFDYYKLLFNEGTKRICENCQDECLATLYCEHCVRDYLKANFSNWTSGNNDIDNLLQKCQMEVIRPDWIVEWIPYNNLQNIKYLTKGGFSEIYTASWLDGCYNEWDSKEKQLKRLELHGLVQQVALKKLVNVERANRNWLEEGKSHLTMSIKYGRIVKCYGLTKDPLDGNYMLVMNEMDINLRKYLQKNHNKLTWKEKIQMAHDIIFALLRIHQENAIHRDLHSGNILFTQLSQKFLISDLGFCGPAYKSLNSIYGNLPYIAPEVISGKETTFASDIYSIGMLMWEISSEQPPFINYEHDFDLAMKIINGMRPKIVPGTPLEYENLMDQCWDADPTKRPDINHLDNKIGEMNRSNYQNMLDESKKNKNIIKKFIKKTKLFQSSKTKTEDHILKLNKTSNFETNNYTSEKLLTSKVYQFENFPEPRNATEGEQEAFHSEPYNFSIPDNISDFNNLSNNENGSTLKSDSSFKDSNKNLLKEFKKLQVNSDNDIQNDYERETIQQIKGHNTDDIDDLDEVYNNYNNPNLHSEEQDEFEIPDDMDL